MRFSTHKRCAICRRHAAVVYFRQAADPRLQARLARRSAACLCQFRQPLLADYLDEAMKVFDALDNPTPWYFAERAEIAVAHPDIERPRCGRRCIGVSELDRSWEEEE